MKLIQVTPDEIDEVMLVYNSVKDHNMAGWNEEYPSKEFIQRDISRGQLYCLKDNKEIIACIAYAKEGQFDEISLLTAAYRPTAEILRLVVSRQYQNRGIALQMINELLDLLKQEGCKSVHYIVTEGNIPALKSYSHLNFDYLGIEEMFDMRFLCYAKLL